MAALALGHVTLHHSTSRQLARLTDRLSTILKMSTSNSDANATPITTPKAKPQGRRSGSSQSGRFWVVTITGSLIIIFLAGIVFFFGQVQGREFAPSHFEIRQFSFTEIPLLRLQITPIRRVSESSVLQRYLNTSSLISRPAGQPTDWHIVELTRFGVSTEPADAKLLTDFLSIPYRGFAMQSDHYWHQWSILHPKHAAVLWPQIQKLAERELYLLIPDVFQIADADPQATTESVDAMRERLREFLITSYASLIDDMRAAGMDDVAESLRQEAAVDYPDEARFQSGK